MKPPVFLLKEFSEAVKAARLHHNIPQKELAVLIDEPLATILDVEGIRGRTKRYASTVLKLCYIFGLDYSQFLDPEWKAQLERRLEIWGRR